MVWVWSKTELGGLRLETTVARNGTADLWSVLAASCFLSTIRAQAEVQVRIVGAENSNCWVYQTGSTAPETTTQHLEAFEVLLQIIRRDSELVK